MGIVFLVLFTLAEIALVVLTFVKFRSRPHWRKNRLIFRGAEAALLLGIVLLPTTYLKWRFFAALAALLIMTVFAAIRFLARRKKAEDLRKKAGAVVNCVLSLCFISALLFPAFIFANYNGLPTTGEFKVNQTSAILVDESRADEFENDGSFREVPAHFYYPESESGDFPLVVFSHGAFGYYQSNFSTYAELASNGYVVVALDHPHHAFFTKDTSGKMITVDNQFINDAVKIGDGKGVSDEEIYTISKDWMELRIADGNFVIDTIKEAKQTGALSEAWHAENPELVLDILSKTDTKKIGYMGHSLGGAAGIALARERGDIGAVIDLDGTALGEVVGFENGKAVYEEREFTVPLLVFSREPDYNSEEQSGAYDGLTEGLVNNAKGGKLVEIPGAGHMDFTDLPLFSPFLGSMLGHGEVDSEKCMTEVNSAALNWFDYYLKGEGALNIMARY